MGSTENIISRKDCTLCDVPKRIVGRKHVVDATACPRALAGMIRLGGLLRCAGAERILIFAVGAFGMLRIVRHSMSGRVWAVANSDRISSCGNAGAQQRERKNDSSHKLH